MPSIYGGYRLISRIIDLLIIYGIYSLALSRGADQTTIMIMYSLYYGAAAFNRGITPGRFAVGTKLVRADGAKANAVLIFIRDLCFPVLLPVILLQWLFGLKYSHERIFYIVQTKDAQEATQSYHS